MKRRPVVFLPILLLLCAVILFSSAVNQLEQERHREGRLQLERTLRRTAAACYAAEGFYPPSLSYMQTHYGLRYNEDEYIVHYELFASNLMPDITVLDP